MYAYARLLARRRCVFHGDVAVGGRRHEGEFDAAADVELVAHPEVVGQQAARDAAVYLVWAKRGEIVSLGGLWLEGHGLAVVSETLGLSSRVQRAAPSR